MLQPAELSGHRRRRQTESGSAGRGEREAKEEVQLSVERKKGIPKARVAGAPRGVNRSETEKGAKGKREPNDPLLTVADLQ